MMNQINSKKKGGEKKSRRVKKVGHRNGKQKKKKPRETTDHQRKHVKVHNLVTERETGQKIVPGDSVHLAVPWGYH